MHKIQEEGYESEGSDNSKGKKELLKLKATETLASNLKHLDHRKLANTRS